MWHSVPALQTSRQYFMESIHDQSSPEHSERARAVYILQVSSGNNIIVIRTVDRSMDAL